MKKLLVILLLLFQDHGAWANNDSVNFETCKNYGFEEGTEQFGMCMLKLKELSIQQQREKDQRTHDVLKEVHKFFCIRDTGRNCP